MAKQYRPKADTGENLAVTLTIADTAGGAETRNIKTWPHTPKDAQEERLLSEHPLLTDAPEPKKEK